MKTIVLCFIDDYIVLKEYLHIYFDIKNIILYDKSTLLSNIIYTSDNYYLSIRRIPFFNNKVC